MTARNVTHAKFHSQLFEALEFYRRALAAGPKAMTDVRGQLVGLGISRTVAKRAERRLGVVSEFEDGRWWLALNRTKDKDLDRAQKGRAAARA